MTVAKLVDYVVEADRFAQPPTMGDYFISPSGGSVLSVAKVRRVFGVRRPTYRLIGVRVRFRDLPAGITPMPWPRKVMWADDPNPDAATVVPPIAAAPITTLAVKQMIERKRIVQHRRATQDPDRQQVEQIRVINGSVVQADWRDPDDLAPNKRVARTIHGFRSKDPIDGLEEGSSISKAHARAAKRFRKLYELGAVGLKPAPNLLEARGGGFEAGSGPSESRLLWLERYQAAAAALRPHMLEVVLAIIIRGQTLQDYAAARRIGRSVASGLLIGCLGFLVDYFRELDDAQREPLARDGAP